MTDEDNEAKKPLIRDRILKVNNGSKVYQLPSCKLVHAAFLSLGMVQEIERSVELAAEGDKEHLFAQQVVEWMLRDNDQKGYQEFSSEDQRRLIEIAVEEWGCEDEYEQLTDINGPEVRFYQAVRLLEKEFARQLSESLGKLTANISSSISPIKAIQEEMASSLREILDQNSLATQVGEAFKDINLRMMEQIREIGTLSVPIANFVGTFDAIGSSLRRSYESNILKEVGGTITSYQYLMKDVLPVERFMVLPGVIRYYPTIEMHNTSIVAGQILGGDQYETHPFDLDSFG